MTKGGYNKNDRDRAYLGAPISQITHRHDFPSVGLVQNAPMIVDRRWPTWKLLAMFGDEYSITAFFPAVPAVLGVAGASYVSSWTCMSTAAAGTREDARTS